LHYLRRRARLTQREMAIAVGYSEAHVSRLESDQRLPDMTTLVALIVPALDLDDDPAAVARLLELAAAARGESLSGTSVTLTSRQERTTTTQVGAIEAIPPLPTGMVAREALRRAREALVRERSLLLCGWAGVGKTTLAAALAQELSASQPVFWLTLTEGITASVDVVIRQLALFLLGLGDESLLTLAEHAPDADSPRPLDQQLALISAALARYPALLCFDNAHLIAREAAVLQALGHLAASSPASLLLISREQVALPGVGSQTLGGLTVDEAGELLERLDAQLSPGDAARLIERTAGNPTLLRLAVGQLTDRGSDASLIKHLATEPQVAAYIVQTTTRDLSTAGERLLALLAVLDQPVNAYDETLVDAIQAADGPYDWGAALRELIRRHIIEHPTRAALPPLLRDHVYAGMVDDLERRRRLHLVAAEWLEQGDDPVAAAFHYRRANLPHAAVAVLSGQIEAVLNRGQSSAAAAVVDDLLPAARRSSPELVLPLLSLRGDLLVHTLRAAEAEANYREALALALQPTVRAHLIWRMAASLLQRGHIAETLRLTDDALAALSASDGLLRAHLLTASSKALLMSSRFAEAEERAAEAIRLTGTFDPSLATVAAAIRARAGATVAIVAHITRRIPLAMAEWNAVLAAASAAGLERIRPRALTNLGNLQFEQGNLTAAFATISEAQRGLRRIGDSYALGRLLHSLALMHQARAEWNAAFATIDEACEIKRSTGDKPGLYNSLSQRAYLLLIVGRPDEARDLLEQILAECGPDWEPRARALYLDMLAICQLLLGDIAAARHSLEIVAAIPAAQADGRLAGFWANHQALLRLLEGDQPGAARDLAAAPPADDFDMMLERQLIRSLLALAGGDTAQSQSLALAAEQRAAEAEHPLYVAVARRIAAADPNTPPAAMLWLLWCDPAQSAASHVPQPSQPLEQPVSGGR
jgi:ATP/maltotriose-dependent transcriptional regulator MalT